MSDRQKISRKKGTTSNQSNPSLKPNIPSLSTPSHNVGLESNHTTPQTIQLETSQKQELTVEQQENQENISLKESSKEPVKESAFDSINYLQNVSFIPRHSVQRQSLDFFTEIPKQSIQRQEIEENQEKSELIQAKCSECEREEQEEAEVVQTKLTVGEPGDKYEQEADSVAAKVVEQINSPLSEETIQGKVEPVVTQIMRQGGVGGGTVNQDVEQNIQQARGSGQGLANNVREPMEQAFGTDFSDVKVHTDGQSDVLNRSLNARAFTTGQDIFFKQGEYQPGSKQGQELLAHELTHVVQQSGVITPKTISEQPGIQKLDGVCDDKSNEYQHSLEVLPASDMIQKRQVCDSSGVCWSEAGPEESTYADEPNASYAEDVETLTESTAKQDKDSNEPIFEEYKGQNINKVGYISSRAKEYDIAKTVGVNVRAKPDGSLPHIAKVLYGNKVQVQASDNTNAFYFIVADTGAVGWINKNFVALNPPDPGARLHHITESNLTTILKNEYLDKNLWSLSTGNDYTTLAAALVAANKGRLGVDVDWEKAQKYKDELKEENKRKYYLDSTIDNFAIYHGSKIFKGHNIWLPSTSYIRMLQGSGVIGSRPDWFNTAVDVGNGIAGFFAGVSAGVFGSLWDTLTGLWELGKSIVDTVKKALDGSLFAALESIYNTVTNMTWEDAKKLVDNVITMGKNAFGNFVKQWNHPDTYKQWYFRGQIIGAIALEVVLAIFTGGGALGAKVLAKIGKYFPKLMKVLNKLLKVADDLDFRKRHGKGRGDKSKDRDNDTNRDKDNENMSKADREWEQARVLAALITEEHDIKDTPVKELISLLNTTIAVKFSEVKKYKEIKKSEPNTYKIIQMSRRRRDVDNNYTEKKPKTRPFFRHLQGKTPKQILERAKEAGWKYDGTLRTGKGWIVRDQNGVERIRYRQDKNGKWLHEETGYLRWTDENGNFLDLNGKQVTAGGTPINIDMTQRQIRSLCTDEVEFDRVMQDSHISIKYL